MRERDLVTWQGTTRTPLRDAGVWPRPLQERLPVWIAVGGTPESAARAGSLGLPMYLATLGAPARFQALAALHRDARRIRPLLPVDDIVRSAATWLGTHATLSN